MRRVALLIGAVASVTSCANVPPFLERHYVRGGVQVLDERLVQDGGHSSGPFPGVDVASGVLLEVEHTHATGLEVEVQAINVHSRGLDGFGFRYLGGVRRFWNMDGRIRPNAGLGGSWVDFELKDQFAEDESSGAGAYADTGLDYMITPTHAIGARLRGHLRYEESIGNHGFVGGVEFALVATWRF